jgi:nucleoside-diphosphate-sugar epimerase
MRALVTGAGGFLGRYIVEALLARGDQVRGFARGDYPKLQRLGVDFVRGDIRDSTAVLAACQDIDCVFHTAARPGIEMNGRLYDQINHQGTLNVLAGCRQAGVRRLVYTSSPSCVFAGIDQCDIDESVTPDLDWMKTHRAHYSLSKARAEQAVLAANGDSLRTCALRPHLIWGPRDTHLVPRLIERACRGRLRRVGDGANLVDVTFVENAAEAHLLAADALADNDSPAAGKAYFLSQGEPVNCWQWIDEILALVDLPPVEKSISASAAWRIGGACETTWRLLRLHSEPPMTRFLAAQLTTSHWFDFSAARSDLGYRPRVSTAQGMERLGEWLQAEPSRQRLQRP